MYRGRILATNHHASIRGKSVGSDGVRNELLQQIAEHEEAGPQLLHWFNSILREGSMPANWSEVVMVILPKIQRSRQAKNVRPICLSSATHKRFSSATKPVTTFLRCSVPCAWSANGA